jgi:hypothetical protein
MSDDPHGLADEDVLVADVKIRPAYVSRGKETAMFNGAYWVFR